MYTDNAYLNNSLIDIKDKSKPLIVTSCGTYKLYSRPKLPTWRPKGRVDFQLLYIAAGKAHFHIDGEEKIVHAGHMVLYRPKQPHILTNITVNRSILMSTHGKIMSAQAGSYGTLSCIPAPRPCSTFCQSAYTMPWCFCTIHSTISPK